MKVFIVTAIVISFLCFTGVKSANDVDDILDSIFQGIGSLGNLGSTGGGSIGYKLYYCIAIDF